MPRRTTIKSFPFLDGQHQEIDAKVLPDGYLSAVKNCRLRKDGRFGVRADFTAIGNDTANAADFIPYDLIGFSDTLLSVGDGKGFASDSAPWDIAALSGTDAVDWASTLQDAAISTLGRISAVRKFAGLPESSAHTSLGTRIDCAAAGGIVCIAVEIASTSTFHFFRASTGATVLVTSLSGVRPRVCSVGTKFFFTAVSGGATILLSTFDPATAAIATSLTAAASGIVFSAYDLVTNLAGTGFWVAFNTTAPATVLRPFNSSGAAGSDITGPAVLYGHVTVRESSTRVHLLSVISGGLAELRSYTLAGALSTGPTTLLATSSRQCGLITIGSSNTLTAAMADNTVTPEQVTLLSVDGLTHAVLGASHGDRLLTAKPIVGGTLGFHAVYGGTQPDGVFYSSVLATSGFFEGKATYLYDDKFAALATSADHTPQIAKDTSTGKFYWPSLVNDGDSHPKPVVREFEFGAHPRAQTAALGGSLYLARGIVQAYDTRAIYEAGFFAKPRILSAAASNGGGGLPSSVTLLVAIVFEMRDEQNNLYQSAPSDVSSVVMGGADDTITITYAVPPLALKQFYGSNLRAVAYRSISGIAQLRRAESAVYGSTITLLAADATVRANGVIYTQIGRGALSGTTPHEAPLPADYIWKFGDRLLTANADGAQVSKSAFPGEPVTWSGSVGFTIPKISERIKGVAALDQRGFLFTSERIYWFSGDGPNDLGEGRYSEPLPLPSSTGLETWQSLVETPLGIFFQGSNGQLWVLPRDGSPPVWIGQPVRDTLVSFPTVTSATLVTEEQLVSFTCNNSGGTDSRIVSYDLRAKTWIVDEFGSSTPITAACSYQGRLAMISAGVVYTEKTTLTPSTFIEHGLTSGTIKPDNWHKIVRFGLIGEYRGDCDIYARISHDDGKTFTTMSKIQQLRAANYAVGDTVDVEWTPARWKTDGFRLDFSARTPGSATEGFVFNEYWIEYIPERGTSRRATAQRG